MVDKAAIVTAKEFIAQIPADLKLKKAYLFGSYAKGQEREESDIDIAVVLGNMTDFFTVQLLLFRLRRNIDLRIEPHPFSEEDFTDVNPLAWEIIKNGIELTLN